ncbi:DUF3168 domain-containing protein [Oricola thermophila]|uniref:DUF3168 domain-containing protein n=1 Tax=Oricola thermophila TaxID=2742145 RepID=A0A6N1VH62_9HYPH|nr:DUF3168 domain-containing protein [Oricola thermophila]QKV18632.1 DUF3168 domain-containing protein [Oricola thermophila]
MGAAHDLQAAIVAALRGDAELVALLGDAGRITDRVPPDRAFPFVAIGRTAVSDWSTDDSAGEEHLVTLRCWSRATGRAELLAVAERVTAALSGLSGIHGGTRIVSLLPVSAEHGFEAADRAWRAVLRFRALTEPA